MFFCIAMLEDTGYMARAVFLIDRVMRGVGLHGHSFIPLVMGFGCNVPAIMATRAIADRKVRLTTMLVDPGLRASDIFALPIGPWGIAVRDLPIGHRCCNVNSVDFSKDVTPWG